MEKKKLFLTESTESGRLGVVAPSQILEIKSAGQVGIGGVAFFTTDDHDCMNKIDDVASEQPKDAVLKAELGREGADWKRRCMEIEDDLRIAIKALETIAVNAESQLSALKYFQNGYESDVWKCANWYRSVATQAINRVVKS